MDETAKTRKTRNPYRYHGDDVWALVRERYLAGESARQIGEALGPTEYAIRSRITREGWTKRSLAEAKSAGIVAAARADREAGVAALAGPAGADGPEALDPRAAARAALDEAVRLMRRGRMAAAAEAARVADVMARAAARLDGDASADPGEPDEAAYEAVRRKVLGLDPPLLGEGDREAVEGVFGDDGAWERPPPPPFGRSPSPRRGGFE
ncbi:hypothetical protein [uncultured Brevundimonas sp.]|uniref:hypothetical protein n=1 Tax=uncultured Brevundimonas sp. TaxID=213418 RepID=UPI00260C19FB|nr:hypothetical protein [uncultured Brevundimonas sp.]